MLRPVTLHKWSVSCHNMLQSVAGDSLLNGD